MKHLSLYPAAAIAAALVFAVPVSAQAPAAPAPGLTVGATVHDAAGGVSGTIESINGDVVVINTGTNKVGLGKASFAMAPTGPIISMTKAELDASAAKAAADAQAAFNAALVPGTTVYGSDGAVAGTIKEVDPSLVTLTTTAGDAKLPRNALAKGASGLTIGMTAAQLQASVAAARPVPAKK